MTDSEQQQILQNWLREHKALLFKVVRIYAFNEADRNDLFQEISLQVWQSIPNFEQKCAVTTWLYRIALNTALRWNRNNQKYNTGHQSLDDVQVLQKNEQPKNERLDWLYKEIGKLDVIDRSLCLLMLDGFSYLEMSDILGITESNVGVKIHRIKKHLINQSKKI